MCTIDLRVSQFTYPLIDLTILAPPANLKAVTSKSKFTTHVTWSNSSEAYEIALNGQVNKVSRTNKNTWTVDHELDTVNFVLARERLGQHTSIWGSTLQSFPNGMIVEPLVVGGWSGWL